MERAVARLNTRLERPIEPFRLLGRFDLIQRLLYHPDVAEAIVEYAAQTNVREDVAFDRARRYAREIVPSFSAFTYFGWGVRVARILSNALYRVRLSHHDPAQLSQIDPDATLIFVMNHRSNMDYVLVTHLAAERSALSYAVGEWARIWPLSGLIRSMGAYFIRRRSRDGLYPKVLRRYVQMSTNAGVTQAIFPEGGLSLDGAMAPPKLGLLSYIAETLDEIDRDVVFVPVGLNYDRVIEDSVLVKAGQEGKRKFNARITHVTLATLKIFVLWLARRYHRFGLAAVSFGKPVSMREHPELGKDPRLLGATLAERIASCVPVLPVPVLAHLLLEQDLTRPELEAGFAKALEALSGSHIHLPDDDPDLAVEAGLKRLVRRGIVIDQSGTYTVPQDMKPLASYYANSIRHLF